MFRCESYRAVLVDPAPDLNGEASSSITGHIRINYSGVDKSRKVGTDCGQMTAVCKPWRGNVKVCILTKTFFHQ